MVKACLASAGATVLAGPAAVGLVVAAVFVPVALPVARRAEGEVVVCGWLCAARAAFASSMRAVSDCSGAVRRTTVRATAAVVVVAAKT
jgi:hypothetical protein